MMKFRGGEKNSNIKVSTSKGLFYYMRVKLDRNEDTVVTTVEEGDMKENDNQEKVQSMT